MKIKETIRNWFSDFTEARPGSQKVEGEFKIQKKNIPQVISFFLRDLDFKFKEIFDYEIPNNVKNDTTTYIIVKENYKEIKFILPNSITLDELKLKIQLYIGSQI